MGVALAVLKKKGLSAPSDDTINQETKTRFAQEKKENLPGEGKKKEAERSGSEEKKKNPSAPKRFAPQASHQTWLRLRRIVTQGGSFVVRGRCGEKDATTKHSPGADQSRKVLLSVELSRTFSKGAADEEAAREASVKMKVMPAKKTVSSDRQNGKFVPKPRVGSRRCRGKKKKKELQRLFQHSKAALAKWREHLSEGPDLLKKDSRSPQKGSIMGYADALVRSHVERNSPLYYQERS